VTAYSTFVILILLEAVFIATAMALAYDVMLKLDTFAMTISVEMRTSKDATSVVVVVEVVVVVRGVDVVGDTNVAVNVVLDCSDSGSVSGSAPVVVGVTSVVLDGSGSGSAPVVVGVTNFVLDGSGSSSGATVRFVALTVRFVTLMTITSTTGATTFLTLTV